MLSILLVMWRNLTDLCNVFVTQIELLWVLELFHIVWFGGKSLMMSKLAVVHRLLDLLIIEARGLRF